MKRISLIAFIVTFALLAGAAVFGQTMHPADQKTIAWDEAENATSYRVLVRPAPDGEAVQVGETEQLFFAVTMPSEGSWFVGVQSVRVENDQVVGESTISWSNDPEVVAGGETFGIIYFAPPATVGGLRVQ